MYWGGGSIGSGSILGLFSTTNVLDYKPHESKYYKEGEPTFQLSSFWDHVLSRRSCVACFKAVWYETTSCLVNSKEVMSDTPHSLVIHSRVYTNISHKIVT